MSVLTTPHLNFRGQARDALSFYQSVFGGDLTVVTYADAHNITADDEADQVMWGQVESPEGLRVMAYDVPSHTPWEPGVIPVFVSVRGTDTAELTAYWDKLSDGASVVVPLGPSGWAPLYGMLRDTFGITWVLDIAVAWDAS